MLGETPLLSTMGHPNIVWMFDVNTVQPPRVCAASSPWSTSSAAAWSGWLRHTGQIPADCSQRQDPLMKNRCAGQFIQRGLTAKGWLE